MFRALFTAASGMTAQQMNLDNVANNLSNASTAGFRRRRVQFQDLVYRVAGIFHSDARLPFLEERCGRRMKKLNLTSLRRYYDILTVSADRTAEMRELLMEVTVGETCFFRNTPQLDAFRTQVLPSAVASKSRLPLKHIRIWSAGCSTGEEPYTLAMICMEEANNGCLKGFTFEIAATDLNDRSVAHARQGLYGEYAIRNTPALFLQKYLSPRVDGWSVNDNVRSHVRVSQMNLLDDSRMLFMKGMDVIFCCNVLIYFDGASKRKVIQHFYNNLLPGSHFFLGHSESLFGVNGDFRLVHFTGATGYLKPLPAKVGV
jgi:chemotaxis protein methyltransferase CheR